MPKNYPYGYSPMEHNQMSEMFFLIGDLKIPIMGEPFELATAYIPYQMLNKIYEPSKGLMKGTIFPELYRPYHKGERD